MEEILVILRFVMAGVFITAATAKLLDFTGAKKAMHDFGIPAEACGFATSLLIVVEFCIAFFLIPAETYKVAAVLSAVLLLIFTVAMLRLLVVGKTADCRCFGQLQSRPVDRGSIVRNIILIAVALSISVLPGSGLDIFGFASSEKANIVIALFGFAAWVAITASVILGLESRKKLEGIEERLETLEATAAFIGKNEIAGDPQEGMPVGSNVREVELVDLSGEVFSLSELWSKGKPLLAILAGPNCGPCEALAPSFAAWAKELSKTVNIAIISSGDANENLEKFGAVNKSRLFLQNDNKAALALGSKWTPTAVLVNTDGRIASRAAAGDTAIEKLIDVVREAKFKQDRPLFIGENGDSAPKGFGMEIGDFGLNTVAGSVFGKSDLIGKHTLVVFWSLTCPHCTEMLDQLMAWRSNGSDVSLVIFAEGDEAKLLDTGLGDSLIVDQGYKVSETFGMHGTPSAVIIDPQGRIISEVVAGAERIRLLAGYE